jgi:hypothetical protein
VAYLPFLPDGTVLGFGCMDATGQLLVGNANELTLREIWTGPWLRQLRESFARCELEPLSRTFAWDVLHELLLGHPRLSTYRTGQGIWAC